MIIRRLAGRPVQHYVEWSDHQIFPFFSCKRPKKKKKKRAKSFSFNQSVLWCLWSNVITAWSGLSRLAILISSCAEGNADNNCESGRPARAMREVNPVTLVCCRVDVRPGLVHAVPQLVGCVCNLQCRRNVCSRIVNSYILASAVAEPVFFFFFQQTLQSALLFYFFLWVILQWVLLSFGWFSDGKTRPCNLLVPFFFFLLVTTLLKRPFWFLQPK